MLVIHLWSFAGSSTREDVSLTQIQVQFSYQFSNGWYIDTNPTMTYDWKAPSNQGMSLQLGAYYNA
jgi:hypothetical protein